MKPQLEWNATCKWVNLAILILISRHDFDSELETLNQQLCKALVDLQSSFELNFVHELKSGKFGFYGSKNFTLKNATQQIIYNLAKNSLDYCPVYKN
jgi:hypothetical protein